MLRNLRYTEDGAILADYVEEDGASRRIEPGEDLHLAATAKSRPFGAIAPWVAPAIDPEAERLKDRAAMSVTSLQLRLAAGEKALAFSGFLGTWAERQMLDFAGTVPRLSRTAEVWGRALKLSEVELDELFAKAAEIPV